MYILKANKSQNELQQNANSLLASVKTILPTHEKSYLGKYSNQMQ